MDNDSASGGATLAGGPTAPNRSHEWQGQGAATGRHKHRICSRQVPKRPAQAFGDHLANVAAHFRGTVAETRGMRESLMRRSPIVGAIADDQAENCGIYVISAANCFGDFDGRERR